MMSRSLFILVFLCFVYASAAQKTGTADVDNADGHGELRRGMRMLEIKDDTKSEVGKNGNIERKAKKAKKGMMPTPKPSTEKLTPTKPPTQKPPTPKPSTKKLPPTKSPTQMLTPTKSPTQMLTPTKSPTKSPTQMLTPTKLPTQKPTPQPTTPKFKQGNTFPATNGQTRNLHPQGGSAEPSNIVCGAIQAVLAHPTNPNICFAGAVNGGVWRTNTCTSPIPDWQPLTDAQESLSVSDMVFDKTDTSSNTILVAVGKRSSLSTFGGPAIGLLYTTNALDPQPTWQVLDNQAGTINFRDKKVKFRSAFVRGSLMLAAAYEASPLLCNNVGIFRSTDGGSTWTNVLLGIAYALAADPNDENRFYAMLDVTASCNAGFPNNGVFTSTDNGVTWTFTSLVPGTRQLNEGELSNGKLSASSNSRIWSSQSINGKDATIAFSDNHGTTWVKMDDIQIKEADNKIYGLNPGGQGDKHFSMLASLTNPNEVYAGGDLQKPLSNFIGATGYTGRLFRGDASVAAAGEIPSKQWEHLTDNQGIVAIPGGGTASQSGPHADSRDMELRADGSLLEVDDGGINVRTSPSDNTGDWFGLCGNMQVFESHTVAYEPVGGMLLFANQDTGIILGNLGQEGTFSSISLGDGNVAMIDYTSDPTFSFFYYGSQNLGSFSRRKAPKTPGTSPEEVDISTGLAYRGNFVTVAAMNPADQKVFAVAVELQPENGGPYNRIALTMDRGDNFNEVSLQISTDSITSMMWSKDGTILYVATGINFYKCAYISGTTSLNCIRSNSQLSATVRRLAVNADDSNEVYAVTTNGALSEPGVSISKDGGASWTDITIPGSPVDLAAKGGSVAYIKKGTASAVVVGTSNGVHVLKNSIPPAWIALATGLPKTPVMDMLYEEKDDRLVVSTLGRGVWYLESASAAVSLVLTGIMPPAVAGPPDYTGITIYDMFPNGQTPVIQVPPIASIPDGESSTV